MNNIKIFIMTRPTKIIDIHSHVFNLKYLPVRGILRSRGVPKIFAKPASKILIFLTNSSSFNKSIDGIKPLLDDESDDFSMKLLDLNEEEIIEDISIKASVHPHLFEMPSFIRAMDLINKQEGEHINSYLYEYELAQLDKSGLLKYRKEKAGKILRKALEGFNYIKWFRFMMRQEITIAKNLYEDNNEVNLFVAHMMDCDRFFYKSKRKYDYSFFGRRSKFQKMKGLKKTSNNKLIIFGPFNPKKSDSLDRLKEAYASGIIKGIKFYPPMGYKAIGNSKKPVWDERIKDLFRWCIKEDIPVFTHCTPTGFEAIPNKTGINSNSQYWKNLLSIKEFSKLRLCLGHAGGEEGWEDDFNEVDPFPRVTNEYYKNEYPYSKLVYELCITYENVYCEIGFLSHIYDDRLLDNFVKRLKFLLNSQDNQKFSFSNKICYGSDYHILFNEGIHKTYLDKYIDIFSDEAFNNYRDKFFYENSISYLN